MRHSFPKFSALIQSGQIFGQNGNFSMLNINHVGENERTNWQ